MRRSPGPRVSTTAAGRRWTHPWSPARTVLWYGRACTGPPIGSAHPTRPPQSWCTSPFASKAHTSTRRRLNTRRVRCLPEAVSAQSVARQGFRGGSRLRRSHGQPEVGVQASISPVVGTAFYRGRLGFWRIDGGELLRSGRHHRQTAVGLSDWRRDVLERDVIRGGRPAANRGYVGSRAVRFRAAVKSATDHSSRRTGPRPTRGELTI